MHVIIAGDSGVYYGKLIGEVGSGGVARLEGARHLRRYYVAGRQGDGSAADLARLGLDPTSPSVTGAVEGVSTLLGVRRVFPVSAAARLGKLVPVRHRVASIDSAAWDLAARRAAKSQAVKRTPELRAAFRRRWYLAQRPEPVRQVSLFAPRGVSP